METFKHATRRGTSLSFKIPWVGAHHPCQPSTLHVVSAGSLISATQVPCLQNGYNTHFTELFEVSTRSSRSLDSGPACGQRPPPSLLPRPQVPKLPPPITSSFCSSHPHQNEPHWAGGLRELKHAIKQLLDGRCFRNFRLHLLLNLILSSDAHYAQDGISCGLSALSHRQEAAHVSAAAHVFPPS